MGKKIISFIIGVFVVVLWGSKVGFAADVVVKKGDTLWDIAQKYQTTVENLVNNNHLRSHLIYPKQILQIQSAKAIIVKKGDTLWKLSNIHKTTVEQLMKTNRLSSQLIFPGQKLTLTYSPTSTNKSTSTTTKNKPTSPTTREIIMTATAYTAHDFGCSGITATGINLRKNPNQKVIAVDPKIIPLGTRVYVEGYGNAIAGDTGGAIKGNKIDLFIPTYREAMNWGKRKVKVQILS